MPNSPYLIDILYNPNEPDIITQIIDNNKPTRMFIVIFNMGYRDAKLFTNAAGFVEEFSTREDAERRASAEISSSKYRAFSVYQKPKHHAAS
jgi:hypothetical protein